MGKEFGFLTIGYGRTSNTYEVGDIVAFKRLNNGRLIHRITSITDGVAIIQGDNKHDEKDCIPLHKIEFKIKYFIKLI